MPAVNLTSKPWRLTPQAARPRAQPERRGAHRATRERRSMPRMLLVTPDAAGRRRAFLRARIIHGKESRLTLI
jgi:hypothetical protein